MRCPDDEAGQSEAECAALALRRSCSASVMRDSRGEIRADPAPPRPRRQDPPPRAAAPSDRRRRQRSGAPAPDHRAAAIVLRIGINLGDVIMEGEDIYGDGVNIAARLEPLAERAVSASRRLSTKASAIASTSGSRTAER